MRIKKLTVYSYKYTQNDYHGIKQLATNNGCPETTPNCLKTIGFIKPFLFEDPTSEMVEKVDRYCVAIIQIQERKAKRSDVTHQVNVHIRKEREKGNTITRSDRRDIRKEIEHSLSKVAIPTQTDIEIIFQIEKGLLWVGSSNTSHLDQVQQVLNGAGLTMLLNVFSTEMEKDLTSFRKDPNLLKDGFELGDKASLANSEDKAKARYTGQNLLSDELDTNVEKQKQVTHAEFNYEDAVIFSISGSQALTSIKFDLEKCIEHLEFEKEDDGDELHHAKQNLNIKLQMLGEAIPKLFGMFDSVDSGESFEIT